jgi:hypothetical protein
MKIMTKTRRIRMTEQKIDEIRIEFEQYMVKEYIHSSTSLAFARNEHRYFDSEVEMAWKVFKAGFNYAKGKK